MAQKARTPDPPRRVQAPKLREHRAPAQDDQRRAKLVLYGTAALGIVGLIVAVALIAFGGGSASAREAIVDAGGTLQEVDALKAANHVNTPPKRSAYNTWPPTSGPHNPTPAPYDIYSEPVEQYRLVHNLEHGSIVVQYGRTIPQATVDQIAAWWRNDPNGIVVAPLPELGNRIVLEAWTAPEGGEGGTAYLARLPRFDEKAFDAFVDAYGFRGPERFPRELLSPNT